jgi:hypothetical protein
MKPRRAIASGARGVAGSDQARRNAALMLQSLSGACGPLEASRGMGVALARYYQLEARVLQAIVGSLEPRPRGRRETEEARERKSAERVRSLERELHRYQALYRTVQKTLGVAPPLATKSEEKNAKKTRRVRKVTRGERVAKSLVGPSTTPTVAAGTAAEGSAEP